MPVRAAIRFLLASALLVLASWQWDPDGRSTASAERSVPQATATSFAGRIELLSEEGGDFDTDNLISNERSFLEIVPALKAAGATGGAYIGVGPDQNFSYIA